MTHATEGDQPRKPSRRTGSSDEVLQTYDRLIAIGVTPIPLQPRRKAVVPRYKNYPQADYQPPPRSEWERNDWGIGAKLGPPLGDADADCDEARQFAPYLFPRTPFTFGRDGARGSHRGYRIDSEFHHQFVDPNLAKRKDARAMILELRARPSLQTVMPGSIHEGTGSLICFEPPDAIPLLTAASDEATLYRAAAKTAIATLVVRYLWHQGSRNELLLPLVGLLGHAGWDEKDALGLIEAVADETGDDDAKNRLVNTRRTFRKDAAGNKTTGAPTLRKRVGEIDRELTPVVDAIQRWARGPNGGGPFPDLTKDGNPRPTLPNTIAGLEQLSIESSFDKFKLKYYTTGSEIEEFAGEFNDAATTGCAS